MERVVGLAVITYERYNYLTKCLESLKENSWGGATVRAVVDDGSKSPYQKMVLDKVDPTDVKVLRHSDNKGVAEAKNTAVQYLIDEGCTDIFLMEDDILMKNPATCRLYINYAQLMGVQHVNFGLHGDANKGKGKSAYVNNRMCWVYPDIVGAFSYYTRKCLEVVGKFDTNFYNAKEHVEHTYRIAEAGLTTPFWYFIDYPKSNELLEEIPSSLDQSVIRKQPLWKVHVATSEAYFQKKHGKDLPQRPKW